MSPKIRKIIIIIREISAVIVCTKLGIMLCYRAYHKMFWPDVLLMSVSLYILYLFIKRTVWRSIILIARIIGQNKKS